MASQKVAAICALIESLALDHVELRLSQYTLFEYYVTHTFWSWSLALISKLRKVIGS